MSLVAYGNSSDSEDDTSDVEEEVQAPKAIIPTVTKPQSTESSPPATFTLPTPSKPTVDIIAEEDDEFLRKKAVPAEKPPPPPVAKKGPVRITIPSLNDFKDLDKEDSERSGKKTAPGPVNNKPSGLLNFLPKPKAEQLFPRTPVPTPAGTIPKTTTRSFMPHSVAKKTTAAATVSKPKVAEKKSLIPSLEYSDDEEEEEEDGGPSATSTDFFSLTSDDKDALPAVSKNEIQLMVARKAAKIAESTAKFERQAAEEEERLRVAQEAAAAEQAALWEQQQQNAVDQEALQALMGGSRAKRQRMENVDVIELSHEQVMPNKEEWMRTTVAASTTAQVRGQLKDGPKGMAKKKHQITYLAHQAKSNEAELQAIWAANRSTQRQSASKYGW